MKTGEEKVHPQIGKDDCAKSHDGEQGGLATSPLMGISRM